MEPLEKNELYELEILKHVESSPRLNNRMAAGKLGCSVKLAHALLGKMVRKGLLHIKKRHSRRWDYFLTPNGIAEKTRLTYEFLDFSMRYYRDARRHSSQLCRDLAKDGIETVAFIGAGDLAEIVYLGVQEWNLTLTEVYSDVHATFLGKKTKPTSDVDDGAAAAVIVCLYDKKNPNRPRYLPDNIRCRDNFHWIMEGKLKE